MANKLASLILSIYIALTLFTNAFFIKTLTVTEGSDKLFWNKLGVLLILVVPVFILVIRYVSEPFSRGGGMRSLRSLVLGVALAGLIVSIFYHVIPLEPIYDLPAQVDKVFASDIAFTVWLIVPLMALFI